MGLEHAKTPYCVRLSPSHVGGRAVISQNFRRHFALIIIAGSTVVVLLSTCQVSMTYFVCMNFDCRPTCVRPHICLRSVSVPSTSLLVESGERRIFAVLSSNTQWRRILFIYRLVYIVGPIHMQAYPPTFFSAPSNINGMINIVRDPCRIHLFN